VCVLEAVVNPNRSSDRCRQEAFRRRHQATVPEVPLPPKGKRRAVTVYACDSCGERALGEQYCEECRTFMRSLGRGDLCPHCGGAVAVSDLLGDDQPLPPAGTAKVTTAPAAARRAGSARWAPVLTPGVRLPAHPGARPSAQRAEGRRWSPN
jgi:hypothetical protein